MQAFAGNLIADGLKTTADFIETRARCAAPSRSPRREMESFVRIAGLSKLVLLAQILLTDILAV